MQTLLAVALVGLASTVPAGDASRSVPSWGASATLAVGTGGLGVAWTSGLDGWQGHWMAGIRALGTTRLAWDFDRPALTDDGAAILLGHRRRTEGASASLSAGPAYLRTVRSGELLDREGSGLFGGSEYERIEDAGLGVAYEAKFMLTKRHAGLGVVAFGVAGARSFRAVALVVDVGRLR